ncbi:MAG: PilN domain-containing protein [Acidimicrobiia bacterium]|nr:PilN domain-containing protein [Acidimicrobiia bacterium]MBT8250379.1 PilN domain-containing protein [Acidimicrobiia bacterium]NNC43310.1 PilN domain-containing protein [Acidimicrobiia bacterium]NND13631.1 PilN domain-containing protein [Acidimicrobiia bacterium]NNL28543.1 PilN domain-containing protein [Acidimicrobiia bacterium]
MRDINLLPGEIFEEEASRRNRVILLAGLVLLVVLLAFLTLGRLTTVRDLEDDLVAQQQANAAKQAEIDSLGQFEIPLQNFDARSELVVAALAGDVSWARLLNDLGRFIPDRVWLSNLTGNDVQVTVSGTAFEYEDVANWLRSIDNTSYAGLGSTWVTSVTATDVNGVAVVGYQSSAQLTDEAASARIASRIPEIS